MTRILELEEGQITYEVLGMGPPVLGMPGGPGVSASYVSLYARDLTDVLCWYLVDPPGTGGTSPPAEDDGYSIEQHARFYRDAARALGLDKYIVFGHSYSAIVALTMAAHNQQEALGCILTGAPAVGIEPDRVEGSPIRKEMNVLLARHQDAPWYEDALKAWDESPSSPDELKNVMRRTIPLDFSSPDDPENRRAMAEILDHISPSPGPMNWFYEKEWPVLDLRPLLSQIRCPVLVVVGEHDWDAPPSQARIIEQGVSNTTVVVVPSCGHWVAVEAPEAFQAAVRNWLNQNRQKLLI